eukprot:UN03129
MSIDEPSPSSVPQGNNNHSNNTFRRIDSITPQSEYNIHQPNNISNNRNEQREQDSMSIL